MLVPIDLLEPILEPMLKTGRAGGEPRPWLGMYTTDAGAKLVVAAVAPGGPAERAGVKVGDLVLEIAGEKPTGLADLWRKLWLVGPPGCEVPLKMLRKNRVLEPRLQSADRNDFLKKPHLH
jgi:S1-C subfamily serine protease